MNTKNMLYSLFLMLHVSMQAIVDYVPVRDTKASKLRRENALKKINESKYFKKKAPLKEISSNQNSFSLESKPSISGSVSSQDSFASSVGPKDSFVSSVVSKDDNSFESKPINFNDFDSAAPSKFEKRARGGNSRKELHDQEILDFNNPSLMWNEKNAFDVARASKVRERSSIKNKMSEAQARQAAEKLNILQAKSDWKKQANQPPAKKVIDLGPEAEKVNSLDEEILSNKSKSDVKSNDILDLSADFTDHPFGFNNQFSSSEQSLKSSIPSKDENGFESKPINFNDFDSAAPSKFEKRARGRNSRKELHDKEILDFNNSSLMWNEKNAFDVVPASKVRERSSIKNKMSEAQARQAAEKLNVLQAKADWKKQANQPPAKKVIDLGSEVERVQSIDEEMLHHQSRSNDALDLSADFTDHPW